MIYFFIYFPCNSAEDASSDEQLAAQQRGNVRVLLVIPFVGFVIGGSGGEGGGAAEKG